MALWYLERYAGSEARLRRVLRDRVRRSIATHSTPEPEEAAQWIEAIAAKLRRLGYIDDERLARARVKTLRARGKSSRAIRAALRHQGIDATLAGDALDEQGDLDAARTYARRRRLVGGQKDLAKLARAGFSYGVAKRALEERSAL